MTPPSLVAACLAVAALAACDGADPPGGPIPEQGIDAGICFLDCFAGANCNGGVLTAAPAGPDVSFPCNQPPPFECPRVVRACEFGCVRDGAFVGGDARVDNTSVYDWLCRTAPAAVAGQPCTTDADCRPTFAAPSTEDAREVAMTYLACGAGDVCTEVAPPVVAGWGEPCTTDANNGGFEVRWDDNTLPGGAPACLVGTSAGCTFATTTCDGDWDCPAGARCDRIVPRIDNAPSAVGVCRPGTWPLREHHLMCP